MAEAIDFSGTITPPTAPIEVSINGGTSFVPLTFATVGSAQTARLTGVPAGTYAAGQLVMRCIGYPATAASNPSVRTVLAATAQTLVDVMLIDGQSNAFGDGPAADFGLPPVSGLHSPDPLREFQRAKIWNPATATWQKLQAGVNSRSVSGAADGIHIGPEIGLAQRWEEDPVNAGKTLYILKYAINGANIEQWLNNVGTYNPSTGPDGYGGMRDYIFAPGLAALTAAGLTANIRGMLWNQWESNTGDGAYAGKLTTYYNKLVTDNFLPSGAKFVVVGSLNDAVILAQQQQFVAAGAGRVLLDGQTLTRDTRNGDAVHISGNGQMKLGRFLAYDALMGRTSPRPQEATLPNCNDTANTFSFTPNPNYPNPQQYTFRNETTGVSTPLPANTPIAGGKIVYTVGNIAAAINTLSVFVSEVEGLNLPGNKLYNNLAFLATAAFDDSAYAGVVATSGSTYTLFTSPVANLAPAGAWRSNNAGATSFNFDPSSGADTRLDATFEIHFEGVGLALNGSRNGGFGTGTYTLDGSTTHQPVAFNTASGVGEVSRVEGLTSGRHVYKFFADGGYCAPTTVVIL